MQNQAKELSLEDAQNRLYAEMKAAQTMYKQLNSEKHQQGYEAKNGRAQYQNWRARAMGAYNYKSDVIDELRSYITQKFGISYKTLHSLQIAIQERGFKAPDWMQEENGSLQELPLFQNGAKDTQETESLPEIQLSLQSQAQHSEILNRLKNARKSAGLSQEEIAAYFGFHGTTLGQWENGRTPITLLNIFKLSAIYECDPLYILTGEEGIKREVLAEVAEYLGVAQSTLDNLLIKLTKQD